MSDENTQKIGYLTEYGASQLGHFTKPGMRVTYTEVAFSWGKLAEDIHAENNCYLGCVSNLGDSIREISPTKHAGWFELLPLRQQRLVERAVHYPQAAFDIDSRDVLALVANLAEMLDRANTGNPVLVPDSSTEHEPGK